MPSIRYGLDIERQGNPDDSRPAPIPKDVSDLQKSPGQGCFICLESYSQGQYAVLVPCLRPRMPRLRTTRKKDLPRASDMLEVNFYFAGDVKSNGRYSIYMEPVNVDKMLEECKERIAWHPTFPFLDPGNGCVKCNEDGERDIDTEELCPECFRVEVENEQKRLKRLLFLSHFTECARNPKKADGLNTLKGMAQKSCIYDLRYVYHTYSMSFLHPYPSKHAKPDIFRQFDLPVQPKEFEGEEPMISLHFVLGWQTDRIHTELPFGVSCALLAVAFIWLCLLIWRGAGGDWGTAFAFAQVVAASFAIVITYARF
ncbi:unnamed protein product [Fusarium venenatum]|uniref:Uncharacterized protein n=1 Tax=Fusarium venenatum TaxID=56646 RepID=A0A2L2SZ01_9HYPO|nr:uncharacterized protein FVRRES_07750 [Fusarium venenatum]CEI63314.1 unnamed protein product [Fusarium venenatum]